MKTAVLTIDRTAIGQAGYGIRVYAGRLKFVLLTNNPVSRVLIHVEARDVMLIQVYMDILPA